MRERNTHCITQIQIGDDEKVIGSSWHEGQMHGAETIAGDNSTNWDHPSLDHMRICTAHSLIWVTFGIIHHIAT